MLPTVIASSVIRSAHQGESHGGVYLVDLNSNDFEQVLDWNDGTINWEGRGADRGLRGIGFYKDQIYLAASNEIFVYDTSFRQLTSFHNRYLHHCHEIFIAGRMLYLTSTGFDSILVFDLEAAKFVKGYWIRRRHQDYPKWTVRVANKLETSQQILANFQNSLNRETIQAQDSKLATLTRTMQFSQFELQIFDPNSNNGPDRKDTLHLNHVFYENNTLYISGTRIDHLMFIRDEALHSFAKVPKGTHNTRPYKTGILMNDTASDQLAYLTLNGQRNHYFSIKQYPVEALEMTDLPEDHARQGFGRGLCLTEQGLMIGGSSPATISVYQFDHPQPIKTVNLTMDIRNAIHGLEVWPY